MSDDKECGCDETYGFDAGRVHCRKCGASWPLAAELRPALPTDSAERKRTPLCTGCLDYAPDALRAVVEVISAPWMRGVEQESSEGADVMYLLTRREETEALAVLALLALCELSDELDPTQRYDWQQVRTLSDLFDVFAGALAAVAQVSWYGNEKHNPGLPLHHARGKSMDHFDCIARHHVERGGFDGPMRHSACKAWRALVALQEHLEAKGAPKARGAK
jgi:hypothetical protein